MGDKLLYIPNNDKQNISLLIEIFVQINEQTNQNLIKVFKGLNQRIILLNTIVIYSPMSPPSLGKSTWQSHTWQQLSFLVLRGLCVLLPVFSSKATIYYLENLVSLSICLPVSHSHLHTDLVYKVHTLVCQPITKSYLLNMSKDYFSKLFSSFRNKKESSNKNSKSQSSFQ